MKSQSLKLFAIAFVLGLVTIFAAGSASAQTRSSFETSFDFHVGKEKFAAGKYELQKMEYGKYLLRSVETKKMGIPAHHFRRKSRRQKDHRIPI
jgi:hypothetical protein